MNERIKELAIEWADQLDWDFPSDPKEYTFSSIALEKFAELIVQECIDIISPYTIRMGRPGEEYLHPIQEIKTHHETCEFAALQREVEELRAENARLREVFAASYSPRPWVRE
jgi:hypothetical protein